MVLSSILNLIPHTQTAVVASFEGNEDLIARLQELGFRLGAEVSFVGRAPFNGPILIRLGATVVALRDEEAMCLCLEVTSEQ
jgi:ferrous iron transport protein A